MLRTKKPCLNCSTPTYYSYCDVCLADGASPESQAKELTQRNFSFASDVYDYDRNPEADDPPGAASTDNGTSEAAQSVKGDVDLGDVVLSVMFAKPSPGVAVPGDISDSIASEPVKPRFSGVPYFPK